MWKTIIRNAADRINNGLKAVSEYTKDKNGDSNESEKGGIPNTTIFGQAMGTAVNKIKDTINNKKKEEENGTEKTEGTI